MWFYAPPSGRLCSADGVFMIAKTSYPRRGCRAAAWLAIGPRFGLSAAARAPGSRPQSCHLPRPPQGITPISVKQVFSWSLWA